jgi:hypothetical protein
MGNAQPTERNRWPRKKIIYGCAEHGQQDTPLMTRYYLYDGRFGQLVIHIFHRSDDYELHDHPWNFWSFILWNGYIEESAVYDVDYSRTNSAFETLGSPPTTRKRKWPGMLLLRKPEHMHRIELRKRILRCDICNNNECGDPVVEEIPAITMVWMGKKVRDWGFLTQWGWQQWEAYSTARRC